jgi:hypothetical protein
VITKPERVVKSSRRPSTARGIGVEADLLGELAQRRRLGRLAAVDAAAGQGPLTGMAAQRGRAARQQHGGPVARQVEARQAVEIGAVAFVDQRDRNRGVVRTGMRMGADLEGAQPPLDQRTQMVVAPGRQRIGRGWHPRSEAVAAAAPTARARSLPS